MRRNFAALSEAGSSPTLTLAADADVDCANSWRCLQVLQKAAGGNPWKSRSLLIFYSSCSSYFCCVNLHLEIMLH